ncbi:hypothetical protein D5S17_35675 [Pseudonocardiaceae bacterium YIM PH 21723]|nr:hypothetical protein D5S17_35675 [Pseudonocardiaceae bacterium YIM PH 21723]
MLFQAPGQQPAPLFLSLPCDMPPVTARRAPAEQAPVEQAPVEEACREVWALLAPADATQGEQSSLAGVMWVGDPAIVVSLKKPKDFCPYCDALRIDGGCPGMEAHAETYRVRLAKKYRLDPDSIQKSQFQVPAHLDVMQGRQHIASQLRTK